MSVAKKITTQSKKNPPTNLKPRVKIVKDSIAADRRGKMISEAAYFMAEQRMFEDGDEIQDWLQAEKVIKQQLNLQD